MNKILKTFGPILMVVALATISVGQVISLGTGKSVSAVSLDTKKFKPQIDTSIRPKRMEREHEMNFKYPVGTLNNLLTGGTLSETRIGDGTNPLFTAMGATGDEPPDPDIAVGPSHIVEVVNTDIAFYTKSGTKLFQQSTQNFFQGVSPQDFESDPKVLYDQVAKRFIVEILSLNFASSGGVSEFLIGVSNTSDPTAGWKLFKVSNLQTVGSNTYWLDYPGFGYNKDMIAFAGNMFAMPGSTGYNGVQIVAFDKNALYNGTATPTKFSLPNGNTTQITKTLDATNPAIYAIEAESQSSIRLTALTKSGSTITSTQASVAIPKWEYDQGYITGPGGVIVQTNDPRLLIASSFNGRILSSHNVAVSSSDLRPAARWYDIQTNNWPVSGTPTLFQSGQVNPPAGHGYSFPAINIDKKGGIGMTFSMIGTTTPGKVMGTGRKASDPAGTMGNPVPLALSLSGQYNGFSTRWGDYFDVELDPTDSTTFWAVGMGAGTSGQWQTFIKSFKISAADSDLIPVSPSGVTTVAGTLVSGDRTSLATTNDINLVMQSAPVKGLVKAAGFNGVYNLPFGGTVDTLRVFITLSGPNGASALISLRNVKTGVYDQISSIGMTGTSQSKTLDLTPDQINQYVTSGNQVSMIIRGVNPARNGVNPAAFSFKVDQASLGVLPTN